MQIYCCALLLSASLHYLFIYLKFDTGDFQRLRLILNLYSAGRHLLINCSRHFPCILIPVTQTVKLIQSVPRYSGEGWFSSRYENTLSELPAVSLRQHSAEVKSLLTAASPG